MRNYYVVKKVATQINAIGELKKLIEQNQKPIVVFDSEAEEMKYIIALEKED